MAGPGDTSGRAAPSGRFEAGLEGLRSAVSRARIFLSRYLGPVLVPVVDLTVGGGERARPRRMLAQLILANSGNSQMPTGDARHHGGGETGADLQGATLADAVRRQTARLSRANDRLEREIRKRQDDEAVSLARQELQTALLSCADDLALATDLQAALEGAVDRMGAALGAGQLLVWGLDRDPDDPYVPKPWHAWCPEDRKSLATDPDFQTWTYADLVLKAAASDLVAQPVSIDISNLPESVRGGLDLAGVRGVSEFPIFAQAEIWGALWFLRDDEALPAGSVEALQLLARIVGPTVARLRQVKALSGLERTLNQVPVIIYRLNAEKNFSLVYITGGVSRFGYDPKYYVKTSDYLLKNIHKKDVKSVLQGFSELKSGHIKDLVTEFRMKMRNGRYAWVENRSVAVRDEAGQTREIEGVIIDINARRITDTEILRNARTDSLTGLANRANFIERLHQANALADRNDSRFVVLFIDLDHFKEVNDSRGHPLGDLLLKAVADRLQKRMREGDLVARLGGDEFAILQPDVDDLSDAGALAADIIALLGVPYAINGDRLHITASIGLAPLTKDIVNPEDLLSQADQALYRAKAEGRNRFCFFSPVLDEEVRTRIALTQDLRQAMDRHELSLVYLPQVEVQSGRIVGLEGSIRWAHPVRGPLDAEVFLSLIDSAGIVDPLSRWALDAVCQQILAWRKAGLDVPPLSISLPLHQLFDLEGFMDALRTILAANEIGPNSILIELSDIGFSKLIRTRSSLPDHLARLGIGLILDDFGVDISTLRYLRSARIRRINIARDLLTDAMGETDQTPVLRAIFKAAQALDIEVTGKGIESAKQKSLLQSISTSMAVQGAYFSKPLCAEVAAGLIQAGHIGTPRKARPRPLPPPA